MHPQPTGSDIAMGRPAQYVIIYKLVEIIDDHGLRADIFGAAKIGFVLEPEIKLLSFTEIEVVVHPEDWALFDELVKKEFNTSHMFTVGIDFHTLILLHSGGMWNNTFCLCLVYQLVYQSLFTLRIWSGTV